MMLTLARGIGLGRRIALLNSLRYLGTDAVRFGGDIAGAAGAQPPFIATTRAAAGGAGV